jgi:hypothetical protein
VRPSDYVGLPGEREDDLAVARVPHVERDRPLAPALAHVLRALAVIAEGRDGAQPVSVRRLLDHDDVGAERRQPSAGESSRIWMPRSRTLTPAGGW